MTKVNVIFTKFLKSVSRLSFRNVYEHSWNWKVLLANAELHADLLVLSEKKA